MNPNKKNKPARNLFRCPKCNKPLAEKRGNQIYLMKYSKGKPMYVKVKVDHDAGGRLEISCDCGGSLVTTTKALEMTYVIKKK